MVEAMIKVMGLDISTSITGCTVLDASIPVIDGGHHIIAMDHVEFKKHPTLWNKADHIRKVFETWALDVRFHNIDKLYVEAAMMRFTPGQSSADTISTLLRFNGLCTYLAREIFKVEPEYLAVGSARKLCGLKMQQKDKSGGKNQKEQTFDAMMATDLKHIVWPKKKRSENIVDYARDIVDSYVIARGGAILNSQAQKQ